MSYCYAIKILIIDDNRNAWNLISSLLKPHNNDIIEVTNGSDAIRIYASELPDCVLMDFEMDGMDGISVMEVIKRILSHCPDNHRHHV
ncbi:MAG: response regulator [Cyclonatronaceae bacterium]